MSKFTKKLRHIVSAPRQGASRRQVRRVLTPLRRVLLLPAPLPEPAAACCSVLRKRVGMTQSIPRIGCS